MRVLLTHHDLDGVGCDILIRNLVPLSKVCNCGYGKVGNIISSGGLSGFDTCIVTDISLTQDQFNTINEEYGNKMVWIDHHPHSLEVAEHALEYDNVVVKMGASATMLVMMKYMEYFKKNKNFTQLSKFVSYVDAYDMWRCDSRPVEFQRGYDLNTLFWDGSYWSFRDRFMCGFDKFSTKELQIISQHNRNRDSSIKETHREELDKETALFLGAARKYINDFSLIFDNYQTFFIVYHSDGMPKLSIRTRKEGIPLDKIIKGIDNENIVSGGGHNKAAGIDFCENVSFDTIIDVVEMIYKKL